MFADFHQKYKLYNDGKFVEVSSTDPGKEVRLTGELNESQKSAFSKLSDAKPH